MYEINNTFYQCSNIVVTSKTKPKYLLKIYKLLKFTVVSFFIGACKNSTIQTQLFMLYRKEKLRYYNNIK